VDKDLQQKIHDANITVHRSEAEYYELIHPEVYGRQEQRRIISTLSRVDKLIADNQRRALDFGAGTGNLTGKLLKMGYTVTSVDISSEMCAILRKRYRSYLEARKLAVVNSSRENLKFKKGEFDLITCYSVLHHMPDYEGALRKLSGFLKKGGAMYIDHEASNYYWETETNSLRYFVKFIYYHSNPAFNSLYFMLIGLNVPSIDYTLSDYWHKKEHPLDHAVIERIFRKGGFQFFQRTDHYVKASWITNPIFVLYKKLCKPEMSCWIAKK
jgi:ubiquinone/menaquinone biosynthesis C-methylase UbiE